MKKIALILICLNLTGCASYFLKKECEKTNWFQHGQEVAMRGQNLENDQLLNSCKKVEADIDEAGIDKGFKKGRANYCEPQTAFATGKKGDPFASEMCDGGNVASLRKRHAEGVREYCDVNNGEPAGATGKTYQNVCPKGMEGAFLREFNKGRKRYLAAEVESRQQQVEDMDKEIRDLQDERQRKTYEMAAVGRTKVVKSERTYDAFGRRRTTEQVSVEDDAGATAERDNIKRDLDNLDWQIRSKRDKQGLVREEVRKLRSEMLAL